MPVNADILNLFLGVKPTDGITPSGPTTIGENSADGSAFADILGMISNPTSSVDENAPVQSSIATESSDDQSFESTTNKLCGPTMPVWMLGRPDEFTGAGQPSTNFALPSVPPTDALGALTPSTENNADAQNIAVSTAPFMIAAQQSMLSVAEPTVLTDGTFKVLDAQVNDSTVELILQSNDTGESIRVSLPLEQLLQGGSNAAVSSLISDHSGRINLAGQSSDLAAWFDKLNLSEVKVETLPQTNLNDNPVKLTLTTTPNAARSGIEISLPKSEIKAFRVSNLGNRLNKSNMNSGGSGSPLEFGVPSVTPVSKAIRVVPRMMSVENAEMLNGMTEELITSSDGQISGTDSKTITPAFGQELKLSSEPGTNRVEFGSVRFTLPDKIEQSLLPGGKSVMVRIHPEHLGPARLNLNWGSDGLSARVTVDSPLAQTAIERSLDKLQEQLSQAGIKVDHIGVSLSGGHTRGQFAHSQSQWQRQSSSNHLYLNADYRASEYVSAVASAPTGMAQYVGSQGVNLFA